MLLKIIKIPGKSVEEEVSEKVKRETILEDLSTLSPAQEAVIKFRFGLEGGRKLKFSEIGRVLKLSKERVRQLEKEALARLRSKKNTKLQEFYYF